MEIKNEKLCSMSTPSHGCCLGEETKIQMADGTQKDICNVRIGDVVQLANGKIKWVENVWRGVEDSWYQLLTESCAKIIASDIHPFLTKEGMVQACHLAPGDVMMIWDNRNCCMKEESLVAVEKVEKGIRVCNLSLGGNQMIANGFVCGDMEIQCSLT